jgi:O-antigen/teichoic acid export membrane protein
LVYFVVKYHGLNFTSFVSLMILARLVPSALNVYFIIKYRLLVGISFRDDISWDMVKPEFLRYSGNMFLLQMIALFAFQADKFVIGFILAASSVTIYAVVTKPMFIIRMVVNQSLIALGPFFAREEHSGNEALVNRMISSGGVVLSVVVFPLVALLCLFNKPFLHLWIGEPYSHYAYWGALGSICFVFGTMYAFFVRYLTYTKQVAIVRNVNIWTTLLNFVVSVVGTYLWGIGGVIVGSLVQAMVQVPIYTRLAMRMRGLSIGDLYPPLMLKNMLYLVVVSLLAGAAVQRWGIDSWWDFFTLLIGSAIALYAYGVLMLLRTGVVPKNVYGDLSLAPRAKVAG